MSLIAMAVHDTEENKRSDFTRLTLRSLFETVNFNKHRLIIVDNNSCVETKTGVYSQFVEQFHKYHILIVSLIKNVGTAAAINQALSTRQPGEHCIKMDNDVVINHVGWIDEMEEAIRREPKIGQVGLKRKDLIESPSRTDFYKSELIMLPHKPGEKWMVAEQVNHIMGTCVMQSSALLDKIGYLYQPALYGFDDSLTSLRSQLAGFINVFLPYIEIDHIDNGGTPYQKWKQKHAGEQWEAYHKLVEEYKNGTRSLYYNPYGSKADSYQ